ncbi:MAG: YfhO family protein [Planctomycetota bacterium]|nr:YfhO family protein [Planctomycetota bacterium]
MTQTLPSNSPNKLFPPMRLSLLGFLFVSILFYPFLLEGQSYCDGDLSIFTLPQFQFISQLLNDGQIPGWNPYLGSGQPLIGDSSLPIFYPLNILHWILDPVTVLNIFLMVHLYLAFLGTYALARVLKLSVYGACFAALSFSFGGVGLSQLTTPMYCMGIAWLLWTLTFFLQSLTAENTLEKQSLTALSIALLVLTGALDYILPTLALCLFFGLFQGASPRTMILPLCKSFFTVGFLSLGMSSLVLAPMFFILPETVRAQGLSYLEASEWSLAPVEWLSLIVPFLFEEGGLKYQVYGAQARPWFFSLHMGILPVILAAFAFLFSPKKSVAKASILTILVFLPFASGAYNPIYRGLFDILPFLSRSRYPAKFFIPVALSLALLSANGFDWWLSKDKKWKTFNKNLAVIGALLLSGLAASYYYEKTTLSWHILAPILTLLCIGAGQFQRAIKIEKVILALTFIELLFCSQFFILFCPRALVNSPPQIGRIIKKQQQKTGCPSILTVSPKAPITAMRMPKLKTTELSLLFFASRQALKANSGMPYGLRSSPAFSPLQLQRTKLIKNALDQSKLDSWSRMQRMGVQHFVFTPFDFDKTPPQLKELGSYGPWKVGALTKKAPWATILPRRSNALTRAETVKAITDNDLEPVKESIIEGQGLPQATKLNNNQQITLTKFEFDRIELNASSKEDGFLVIQEAYAMGWSATIDGKATPIYPANIQFRGIYLPKGRHKIKFQYSSPAWNWAWPLSLLTFLLTLLLICLSRFQSKRRSPEAQGTDHFKPASKGLPVREAQEQ